jgi:hypothetical protein
MTIRRFITQAHPGKTHPTFGAVEPLGFPHCLVPRFRAIASGLRGYVPGVRPSHNSQVQRGLFGARLWHGRAMAEGAPLAAYRFHLTSRNTGSAAFSRANNGCECGTFVLDESPPIQFFKEPKTIQIRKISDAPVLNVRPRPAGDAPELCMNCFARREGAGNAWCPLHPQPPVQR